MNRSFLAFAMALFTAVTVYSAPSIWNGTADVSWYDAGAQNYNLTTPEQLAGLAELVNGGTTDFSGKTVTLGADIFLNDTTGWGAGKWRNKSGLNNWVPIGTETNAFKGEFDGIAGKKNRKIYGLYCKRDGSYIGLFGNASTKIQNIDLLVGYVSGTISHIGAVAGYAKIIENVHSTLHIHPQGESIVSKIGGLAGEADTIRKSSVETDSIVIDYVKDKSGNWIGGIVGMAKVVSESHFEANMLKMGRDINKIGGIAGEASTILVCYVNVDSIVGWAYTGGLVGTGGVIKKSFVEGVITSTNLGVVNENHFGGLAGIVSTIDSSYHMGNVRGKGSRYAGGLAGEVGVINNSYHLGNIEGGGWVGGLAGKADTIKYSYHREGDVIGGSSYVGGLVGQGKAFLKSYAYGNVSQKYSGNYTGGLAGEATIVDSSYHINGNVSSKGGLVGGLVGNALSTIKNSYAEGDVVVSSNTVAKTYWGGLAGQGKEIINSYAKGQVVAGKSSTVGGLAGAATSIDSSYHTGGAVSGVNYVGGLAGKVSSTIKNSYAENDVTGSGKYVGGLVGQGSVIQKSRAEGEVKSDSSYVGGLAGNATTIDSSFCYTEGSVKGFDYVGGLSGNATTISNSHSTVAKIEGRDYVGGLSGNATTVSNSHLVVAEIEGRDYVGGLSGYATSLISNSHSTVTKVEGRNYVGGLVGYANDSVKKSFFEGDSVKGIYQVGGLIGRGSIVDSCRTNANVLGDDNVGGLVGSGYGDVTYSLAKGNVNGDIDNSSAGNDNLGGLVGYQYSGSIHHSAAHGNVNGTTKLGGLVGRFDGTEITQSYANGNVTGSYYGDPADEVGNYYIGGLVGYAKGSVDETYVSGVVKGIEDEPVYTGCIVGYVNGSLNITNSYYDKTKCGLGVDGGEGTASVAGVPDKTTVEMKTKSTFVDWNFEDVWDIVKESYPSLRMEDAVNNIGSSSSATQNSSESGNSNSSQVSSSSAATQNSSGSANSSGSHEPGSSATTQNSSGSVNSSGSYESGSSATTQNSSESTNMNESSGSITTASSDSEMPSDSSTKPKSSNSEKTNHIVLKAHPGFSIQVVGRNLRILEAKKGSSFALFDMQGKVLAKGRLQSADFGLVLANPGNFILRVEGASRKVHIK